MVRLYIKKPGLLTLVQDQGRMGYQAWGVPVGGAMDRFSARLANWLVGNSLEEPVLEITLMGPTIQWETDCQIALTGAHLSSELDGAPLPLYETIDIQAGSTLRFRRPLSGCRAYLAVGGTWDLPSWLGSKSAAFPDGRIVTPHSMLHKDQYISIEARPRISLRTVSADSLPSLETLPFTRVLPGPEFDQIDPVHIGYFFSQPYRISPDSNRMGYRLIGTKLLLMDEKPILSSGVMPGTIQITREGIPILLMADAQTTGGYHRFLQVVQSDLDRLGQAKPGDSLHFALITMEQANVLWKEKKEREQQLWSSLS